jgi:hypothetical protein
MPLENEDRADSKEKSEVLLDKGRRMPNSEAMAVR